MTAVVELTHDGERFIATGYGEVGEPDTYVHHTKGPARDCIHARQPLPQVMLVGRDHIMGYGWQPIIYTGPQWPAIISRTGDIATLAVDHIDGDFPCRGPRRKLDNPALKWVYRLMPLRWWDEEQPADNVLLGVWAD